MMKGNGPRKKRSAFLDARAVEGYNGHERVKRSGEAVGKGQWDRYGK